jgi:bifunctional non-homologous end joining protein LigD
MAARPYFRARRSAASSVSFCRAQRVSSADLRKRLEPLVRKTQAFAKRVAYKGIWVEPMLLAEIEYRANLRREKVRHPFFKGLRKDV